MQNLIAKYGLAAHLALLAAAPLFLFPFCTAHEIAVATLWLSAYAAIWTLMEPSVFGKEDLHRARARTFYHICRDPLLWGMLLLVVLTGIRALNGGVGLTYEVEAQAWKMRTAAMPMLPASAGTAGFPAFAATVGLMVLVVAIRNAMGKSARMAFVLLASALAGAGAMIVLWRFVMGDAAVVTMFSAKQQGVAFAPLAYGVFFLAGTVAIVGALALGWVKTFPLFALAVGGTGAGLFAFAQPVVTAVFAVAEVIVVAYAFFFVHRTLREEKTIEVKCLVFLGVSLTLVVVMVMATLPPATITAKLAPFSSGEFFSAKFLELRTALADLSLKIWRTSPWTGTGLGSFPLVVQFNATDANWDLIPFGQATALNGWRQLLVERGLVGAAMMALPIFALLISYVLGIVQSVSQKVMPAPLCLVGPLAVLAAAAVMCIDMTALRPEAILSIVPLLAVSARAYPKKKKERKKGEKHG